MEDPSAVRIAIITAITVETLAVEQVLDNVVPVDFPGDHHPYRIGTVPSRVASAPHVVAVAQQTSDGTRDAAWLCGHLPGTFQQLRSIVMCGIAGGVPSAESTRDVALGDIVVATELVDYRHERQVDGSSVLRRAVQPPGSVWMNADHEVEAAEMRGAPPWLPTLETAARRGRISRPGPPGRPRAHRGRVGSADVLVRDTLFRDGLARDQRVLAFEMEGAGVAIGSQLGERSWYMVRGVADHGDNATKNDGWHPYASLAAASYLRSVLARCAPFAPRPGGPPIPGPTKLSGLDGLYAMTEALIELRVIRDESLRRTVLDQLPARIRAQIPENALGRLHVIETIKALEAYPHGLDAFLAALRLSLGGDSPEFGKVERVLRENWKGQ